MSEPFIIVVTGASKGIGKEICVQLLSKSEEPVIVYLTARQYDAGQAAVKEIKESEIELGHPESNIFFHLLDITSDTSAYALTKTISERHGYLHVLINNAGLTPPENRFDAQIVAETLNVNYFGTARITVSLLPIMHPSEGRIINMSSCAGMLTILPSMAMRERFTDPDLTLDGLHGLMKRFYNDTADGTWDNDWPNDAYAVSKLAVIALTKVLARNYPDMLVNACDPGLMEPPTTPAPAESDEEGAMTAVFLAITDLDGISGEFWREEDLASWY